MRFRKFGLALVVALVAAFAFTVAPALADETTSDEANAAFFQLPDHGVNPDPQTTNIPYVGWLGNQLKVVKCLRWNKDTSPTDIAAAEATLGVSVSFPGRFQIEDWTGVDENNAGPKWHNGDVGDGGTTVPVEISESGICWSAHVSSNKPGMAVIKLAVSAEVLASLELRFGGLLLDIGPVAIYREVLLKHQFLAIWLQSQTPVINEVAANYPVGNLEDCSPVGDPVGDGVFTPPFDLDLDSRRHLYTCSASSRRRSTVRSRMATTSPVQFKDARSPCRTDWEWARRERSPSTTRRTRWGPGRRPCVGTSMTTVQPDALGGDDDAFHPRLLPAPATAGTSLGTDAVDNCSSGLGHGCVLPRQRRNVAHGWSVRSGPPGRDAAQRRRA